MMTFTYNEPRQISSEFYLVTLRLQEPGKMDQVRDFVVTEFQLVFLHQLKEAWKTEGKP